MQFVIDGVAYKAKQMDGFTQMDIVSLLAPLVAAGGAELIPWLKEMRDTALMGGAPGLLDADPAEALKHFGGLTRELAKMSSEDRRTILTACLTLVQRQIKEGQWADVWIPAARQAAYPELNNNLWLMVRIAFEVIKGQLFPFFSASP
jgi:hypothetical protein